MTEETIFLAALEKKDATERAAYLDAACTGDTVLRRAVEQLLSAHDKQGLLDRPLLGTTGAATIQDESVTVGVHIGSYTLVQLLGEGGMGSVWVAKQSEPVKRKVALKLIKPGMDSKSVVTRFENERQALALMDHPNIARIFDGGVTPDGRPYFVMELVNGLPLTKFCDEARLTPRQRLDLFLAICQAVQHAHQKGIVHRDLKPSNILVTLYDGKPVPKVIDFGVAKALAGKLNDDSISTQFGAVIGTFEYMAPEQASYSALDIDTRADIYSLGVILYELLTGLKPIDGKRLRQAALHELIRILHEDEPPRPSTRFSTEESRPSLAAVRQMEPRGLTEMLRGELDCIVMKCLEKSRDRRYETANALARDVQRYLADETVEARPPSFGYRTGKFFRRNKGTVLTAVVVIVLLLGGIIGTTLGMLEAIHHEGIAKKAADDSRTAEAAEKAAKIEADKAKKDALAKLWGAHLNEANARRFSGRRGQRFESLKAIQAALKLPVPEGRSLDELRNAAIAALCLPDIGDGPEWDPGVGPAVPEHPVFRRGLESQKIWERLPEPKFAARWKDRSPNGRFFLSALEPYTGTKQMTVAMRLWRVDRPEPERVFDDPGVPEEASAFRPDSKQVALGHLDGTVSLYDTDSGKKILKLKTDAGKVFCLEYHPTLPRLAGGAWNGKQGTAFILDLGGAVLQRLPHPKPINSVAWRPDGRQLAVGCDDRRIYLWNAENGKQATPPWAGHSNGGIRLSFNRAGDRIVSNDWSNCHLRLWDARSGKELFHTPETGGAYLEPSLISAYPIGKKQRLLRVAEGHELREVVPVSSTHSDGRLVVFGRPSSAGFLNMANGEEVASVQLKSLDRVSFDESGAMATINSGAYYRWPVRATEAGYEIGPPAKVADVPQDVHNFSCDKSGNVVAVPHFNNGTLVIHRHENNRHVRLQPQYDVRYVAVSPDGRWVATCSHWDDEKGVAIKIWDARSGRLVKDLPIEKARYNPSFSADNRWLITSGGTRGIASLDTRENYTRLWEVGTWNEGAMIPNLGAFFMEHDLSLEGQMDGTVAIMKISTRTEVARLSSPEAGRVSPGWNYSGFVFAFGEASGRMYVWDLPLIRRQLAEMGLDWDGPPYFSEEKMRFARSPYTVRVNAGVLADDVKK